MGISTSGVWENAEASGSALRLDSKTSPLRRMRSESAQESRLGAAGVGARSEIPTMRVSGQSESIMTHPDPVGGNHRLK